ncbi:hypothetical protein D3C71_937960 [compost metagenome]
MVGPETAQGDTAGVPLHRAAWDGRLTSYLLFKPSASDSLSKKGPSNVDAGHEQRLSLRCFARSMQHADAPFIN